MITAGGPVGKRVVSAMLAQRDIPGAISCLESVVANCSPIPKMRKSNAIIAAAIGITAALNG